MTAETRFAAALEGLRTNFAAAQIDWMLIGGLAIVARGVERLTRDVDVVVWGAQVEDLDVFVRQLAASGFEARVTNALEFAKRSHVLLLRHASSGVEVDLGIAWLPFQLEAIERARTVVLAGSPVPVATVEDLIVLKAVAWRAQDRDDIARLAALHRGNFDRRRILDWVHQFATVLDDPERPKALERLLDSLTSPSQEA